MTAFSQQVVWGKQSTETQDWHGPDVRQMEMDADGNIYVLYQLRFNTTLNGVFFQAVGFPDMLLIKYDPNGNVLWWRQAGGADGSLAYDLTIGPSGDVYITGTILGNCNFMGQPLDIANGKAIVARISTNGSLVWVKQYGDANEGFADALAVNGLENVIAVGRYNADDDLLVTCYKYDGTIFWQHKIEYLSCCIVPRVSEIATDAQNNFVIMGSFTGRLRFPAPIGIKDASGSTDIFITKINNAGTYQWWQSVESSGGFAEADPVKVQVDAASNIYLLGDFSNEVYFGAIGLIKKAATNDDAGFLAKMNSAGTFLWAKAINSWNVVPVDLRINPRRNEIMFTALGSKFFNYDEQYVITPTLDPTFFNGVMIRTDLDGNFKSSTKVTRDAYESYSAYFVMNDVDDIFVNGNFREDFSLGCYSFSGSRNMTNFFVKFGKVPEVTIAGHTTICKNSVVRVQVNGADHATKFQWLLPYNVTPVNGTTETTVPYIDLNVGDTDDVYIQVIPYYNCYPQTSYAFLLDIDDAVTKPAKPNGLTVICESTTSTYTTAAVDNADSYVWVVSGNLQVVNNRGNEVDLKAIAASGTATIQVKAVSGCGEGELSDPFVVELRSIPQPPVIDAPDSACVTKEVLFTAAAPGVEKYRWRFSPGSLLLTSNSDSSRVRFNFSLTGLQTITAASVGYCGVSGSKEFYIRLLDVPLPISLTGADAVCIDDEQVTYAITPEQDGETEWTFPGGFTRTDETDFSSTFSIDANAAVGDVRATQSNFCGTVTTSLSVNVSRIPSKPTISVDDCHRKITYSGNESFTWYKDNVALSDGGKELFPADSGSYYIQVSNFCGSTPGDAIIVDPVTEATVFVPNVVTAHVDERNDLFIVDDGLKGSALSIFNRWGKLIYETSNYRNTWNGDDVSGGTYFYVIENHCLPNPLKGIIHLIK